MTAALHGNLLVAKIERALGVDNNLAVHVGSPVLNGTVSQELLVKSALLIVDLTLNVHVDEAARAIVLVPHLGVRLVSHFLLSAAAEIVIVMLVHPQFFQWLLQGRR